MVDNRLKQSFQVFAWISFAQGIFWFFNIWNLYFFGKSSGKVKIVHIL